jgi:deoxyribose-phosphate aldolase
VQIATVANFPQGEDRLEQVLHDIRQALDAGATEIDLVMPQSYRQSQVNHAIEYVKACKLACGPQVKLKVILETGALASPEMIAQASRDMINAGADFLKTSTGKIVTGASLEAAAIMLSEIKASQRPIGFKAAGGVKTANQAAGYLYLVKEMLGETWLTPKLCRIGASSLLLDLYQKLNTE